MARFKSTITDTGAEELTRALAEGRQLILTGAEAGDGVPMVSPNTVKALVHPIQAQAAIGEKTFVDGDPAYMKIPVQVTNAGLSEAVYVREVVTYALNAAGSTFVFSYSWLDGEDSDNILPACSFAGGGLHEDEADTVHIHDVAVIATNQENSAVSIQIAPGSYVTQGEMIAYSAPLLHDHKSDQIRESTGESVETVQRRQDYDITAIKEQLDTGFTGTTATHNFTPGQISQWKGYNGESQPEGILDPSANRLYL